MLWLCVQLPALSLEALALPPDPRPRAVSVLRGGREIVQVADARAAAAGVCPGMTLPAALARAPALCVHPRRALAERRMLRALATWAGRFSAHVALEPDGLLIEAGASRVLFGGVPALMAQLRAGLTERGHAAPRMALACRTAMPWHRRLRACRSQPWCRKCPPRPSRVWSGWVCAGWANCAV